MWQNAPLFPTAASELARHVDYLYFFGIEYPTKDLRLGLIDSTTEKIGNLADQMLLMCYHYDPKAGRYTPAVTRLMQGGGALTLLALVSFIVIMLRRERRGPGGDAKRAA